MYTYKKMPDYQGQPVQTIVRLPDFMYIPFDPANTDFQEYQRWLAEGNTPEPAEQGATE